MLLTMNTNERIEEKMANVVPCRGLYIEIKRGGRFV